MWLEVSRGTNNETGDGQLADVEQNESCPKSFHSNCRVLQLNRKSRWLTSRIKSFDGSQWLKGLANICWFARHSFSNFELTFSCSCSTNNLKLTNGINSGRNILLGKKIIFCLSTKLKTKKIDETMRFHHNWISSFAKLFSMCLEIAKRWWSNYLFAFYVKRLGNLPCLLFIERFVFSLPTRQATQFRQIRLQSKLRLSMWMIHCPWVVKVVSF